MVELTRQVEPKTLESLDAILGISDLSVKPVFIDAWKSTCYVREMSGMQIGYFASLAKLVDGDDAVTLPVEKNGRSRDDVPMR